MLDIKRMDEEIAALEKDGGHSGHFLADIIRVDARGAGDPRRVIESAKFYGDSALLGRYVQLKYLREIQAMEPNSKLAMAVLHQMDALADYKVATKRENEGDNDECEDSGC